MMCDSTGVEKLCRLCGSESGIKINIFEPDTEHVKKIHKLLPITVNEHDPLPKHMCHRCMFKVNEFYDFRTICLKTQEVLKSKIPWLQSNVNGTEAVFVEEPMVQLTGNPLQIQLLDTRENMKSDPLAIDADYQDDAPMMLEPEIVTYTMPSSYIGGNTTNQPVNGAVSQSECQVPLGHPRKISRKSEYHRGPNNKLTKIWRTAWGRKRRTKRGRKPNYMGSKKETDLVFTPSDSFPKTPETMSSVQTNNNRDSHLDEDRSKMCVTEEPPQPDEHHTRICVTEEAPQSENITKVKHGENELPANIIVTDIPRVGFVYTCESCARTFLAADSASKHICDTVPVEIGSGQTGPENLREPERTLLTRETVVSDSANYACHLCGKMCRSLEHVQSHVHQHTVQTRYSCDICDKKFRREAMYNTHLMQHFNKDSSPEREPDEDSLSSWYSD